MGVIRFTFAPQKALQAIHWMLTQQSTIDLHAALKACYFADKSHLNEFYQPIFGATYRAMRYGPVPLEIYEIAKAENLWLLELGTDHLPWDLRGYQLVLTSNDAVDTSLLSESNIQHLATGFEFSSTMTFTQRTAATHGPDWQAADGGIMRYEDMLDDSEIKPKIIEDLLETSRFIKL